MTLSLVDNSIHLACPDDPLLFSVDNVEPVDQPATERYTFFWSTSADSITWKPVGNSQNSFTYSQNMTNAPFYIKVDASYYSMDPQPKFTKSLGMKSLWLQTVNKMFVVKLLQETILMVLILIEKIL
jgi:hypothetical protein